METTVPKKQPFTDFLELLDSGDANSELSDTFDELKGDLMERVRATGTASKATLALKLSLEMNAKGQLTITYDVDSKRPKAVRAESVFWVGDAMECMTAPPRTPIERYAGGERGETTTTNGDAEPKRKPAKEV